MVRLIHIYCCLYLYILDAFHFSGLVIIYAPKSSGHIFHQTDVIFVLSVRWATSFMLSLTDI